MTHLTLDEIADPDTAIGHAHLAGCARCRRAVAEQAEIRTLLSSLPDPGPAPAWVMSRVDRALAEARAADDAAGDVVAAAGARSGSAPTLGPDRTVVPLDARRRRDRRLPTWLAAAAAVVVLGGGGLALRGLTHVGGASDTTASNAAESGASSTRLSPVTIHHSGTDYTPTRLATQLAPLLSSPEVADQRGDSSFSAPTTGGTGRTSGGALDSSGGAAGSADNASGSPASPLSGQPSLLTPSGVAQCLSALGMSGSTVLAVDLARFQGSPAAVIALRPTGSPGGVTQVWVVSPDCRPGADGTKFFATLP